MIAIVVSYFNHEITDKLLEGALIELNHSGIHADQIKVVHVPGAIEIPLAVKLLALSKKYKSIICLGAVIQGETDHYDYVCEQVSQGCQKVMLDLNIPVIFGVLTTKNMEQAYERVSDHQEHKGREAALAALEMIRLTEALIPEAFQF